jgi:hypothetical protein
MNDHNKLAMQMIRWGPVGVSLFAVFISGLMLLLFLIALPASGVDTQPLKDDINLEIVPATGIEGFNVEAFCNDPETAVKFAISPDASEIVTFELTRTRDGVFESVSYVRNAPSATHYFDTVGGQRSEPGEITEKAIECIERKAGLVQVLTGFISPNAAAVRPGQPHPDIFQVAGISNLQDFNPLGQKVKSTQTARYRVIVMPACSVGTMLDDIVKLVLHAKEKVGVTYIRDDVNPDHIIRINCGNDQIRICGSLNTFCLGRGFPGVTDVDMSDILSSYPEATRLSIFCHEVCGHAWGTWNEQYCKGQETGQYPPGHPCFQLTRFSSTPNWPDFMNTGALSRHGFTDLEVERWERTMYALQSPTPVPTPTATPAPATPTQTPTRTATPTATATATPTPTPPVGGTFPNYQPIHALRAIAYLYDRYAQASRSNATVAPGDIHPWDVAVLRDVTKDFSPAPTCNYQPINALRALAYLGDRYAQASRTGGTLDGSTPHPWDQCVILDLINKLSN